ncbi:serine hydrolase [Halomicronema sp. CCY15110]|uniref:serine hydrolase n=1 Tax=Halomicronema sp. CCY15110 TaxID=2767773 RepID=UPI0019520A4B|nr:serine hydrolase [Halomicronema sp. CCY15110]
MAVPFRYRWSKYTLWRDLPLAGLVVGMLTAISVHELPRAARPAGSALEPTVCQAATASSRAFPQRSCNEVALRWQRSPVPPAQLLTQGLGFLDDLAAVSDRPRYPVVAQPPFWQSETPAQSPQLRQIVDGAVALIAAQGLPTESVSISLVDLTGDCCDYAAYQDQQPRYPASIVKLFWLVALYGYYDAGTLLPEVDVYRDDEALMAHYSNNGASSRIVDALTQTTSGDTLPPAELPTWVAARTTLNDYFLRANYPDLNIAHKTLPIPDLGMEERTGRDWQLAHETPEAAGHDTRQRNYLTTAAVARLLYEIDTGQAISPAASDRIKQYLYHSPDPAEWQWTETNAIAGFFGEYLPPDARLYTKLGFTFDDGRQEAAIITSPDQQVRFALVVFANDAVFSEHETILPAIARYSYDQMHRRAATPN